ALRAVGTDAGFLDALYGDVLNRPIDASGKSTFSAQLAAGQSRSAVAAQVFASFEYHLDLIQSIYGRYLDRELDESGRGTWTDLTSHGASDDYLLARILGETVAHEFFDKTLP